MSTKAEFGEFRGNKTVSIWEVNMDGEKTKETPNIAFGVKKAKAILENIDKIEEFVAKNSNNG